MKYSITRRALLGSMAAAPLAGLTGRAYAATNLSFASISSPTHILNASLHKNWIDRVAEQSNGELNVTLFPGGALGKAKQAYDIAVDGIADISYGWTIYYPGRFPLSEALTLPGAIPSREAAHKAYEIFDTYLRPEWEEVKVLWLGIAPGYMISSREKPINTVADMEGLQVGTIGANRCRGRRRMGATPIDITAQDAYLAFQRKSIDAYINTWSSVAANKYGEVASHFTSANLFNSVFFAVMNKSVYDALPDDQRAVIDANSTAEAFNAATDTYWDDEAEAMRKVQEQSGGKAQITEWSAGEKAKFRDLVAPAWDDWESRVSATGKPAGELAAYLRSLA